MKTSYFTLLLLCVPFAQPALSEHHTTTLHVTVHGAKPDQGQIILSLFTSKDNFLKKPVLTQSLAVKSSSATFILTGLQSGKYAISVIYDQDNNNELNTGFFGIPKELVGFSNNVKGVFGPPSFEKAAFNATNLHAMSIKLGNAKD